MATEATRYAFKCSLALRCRTCVSQGKAAALGSYCTITCVLTARIMHCAPFLGPLLCTFATIADAGNLLELYVMRLLSSPAPGSSWCVPSWGPCGGVTCHNLLRCLFWILRAAPDPPCCAPSWGLLG